MHGNAVAALVCHSEFILPTNFTNITNVYRCAIGFSPTDYTDFIDFLFSLYDSLFCFAKIALLIPQITSGILYRTDVKLVIKINQIINSLENISKYEKDIYPYIMHRAMCILHEFVGTRDNRRYAFGSSD